MFNNIGQKIKTLAKFIMWLEIGLSVLSGLGVIIEIMISVEVDTVLQGVLFLILGLVLGAIVVVIGGFIAWVSVLTLYGFGQLVENSDKLAGTGLYTPKRRATKKESKQDALEADFSLSESEEFYKNVKINSIKHNYEAGRLSKEKYEEEMEKFK
ncbi:MAG: hypothetical protein E7561_05895 [Ruminococcaceae bacterium]|nr:hypothetical protein [Oscillospiraceae bacterium]